MLDTAPNNLRYVRLDLSSNCIHDVIGQRALTDLVVALVDLPRMAHLHVDVCNNQAINGIKWGQALERARAPLQSLTILADNCRILVTDPTGYNRFTSHSSTHKGRKFTH